MEAEHDAESKSETSLHGHELALPPDAFIGLAMDIWNSKYDATKFFYYPGTDGWFEYLIMLTINGCYKYDIKQDKWSEFESYPKEIDFMSCSATIDIENEFIYLSHGTKQVLVFTEIIEPKWQFKCNRYSADFCNIKPNVNNIRSCMLPNGDLHIICNHKEQHIRFDTDHYNKSAKFVQASKLGILSTNKLDAYLMNNLHFISKQNVMLLFGGVSRINDSANIGDKTIWFTRYYGKSQSDYIWQKSKLKLCRNWAWNPKFVVVFGELVVVYYCGTRLTDPGSIQILDCHSVDDDINDYEWIRPILDPSQFRVPENVDHIFVDNDNYLHFIRMKRDNIWYHWDALHTKIHLKEVLPVYIYKRYINDDETDMKEDDSLSL